MYQKGTFVRQQSRARLGQPGDQLPHVGAQPWTTEPAVGAPAPAPVPEYFPGLTMPADHTDHSARPNDDEMLTPVATEDTDQEPK